METAVLLLFCACLTCCVVFDFSILYALVAGFFIFCAYGKHKGFTWKQLFSMALSGVSTIKNMLVVFALIGMLTALWRAAGTIPVIVCYAARLIRPSIFLLMAFLLNCGISTLVGTAFGTAATMGVICMTMAMAMEISPALAGGAILAGIFFGDRCSPVSSSALLVSELTGTNLFDTIKGMCHTALVPFAVTCAAYALIGTFTHSAAGNVDVAALFGKSFTLHWAALLPAAAVLLLSVFRVNVKATMLASIALAFVICIVVQRMRLIDVLALMLTGFHSADPNVASMLDGGGVLSMARTAAIVSLSSSYAGLFHGTGLLDHSKALIQRLSGHITAFGGTVCAAVVTNMIACNQTLATMLTNELCSDLTPDKRRFALDLENTVIVIAPLVPWSIAGAVPLATIDAPTSSILAACFLYLLPIWGMLRATAVKSKRRLRNGTSAPA